MKVLLGLTGSVATSVAHKLVAALLDAGHEVKVVATTPAIYFLKTPPFDAEKLTMDVSGQEVEVFIDKDEWPAGGYHKGDPVKHIDFRKWADALLIAPLSANTLAKIANGIADNFLTCICRAWVKDRLFLVAPAMNTEMWQDPITEEHHMLINKRFSSFVWISPVSKMLACKDEGMGAMAEIERIVQALHTWKL